MRMCVRFGSGALWNGALGSGATSWTLQWGTRVPVLLISKYRYWIHTTKILFHFSKTLTIKPKHKPLDVPNRLRPKLPDIIDSRKPIWRPDRHRQIRNIHFRSHTPGAVRKNVRGEPIMDMEILQRGGRRRASVEKQSIINATTGGSADIWIFLHKWLKEEQPLDVCAQDNGAWDPGESF